MLLIVFLAHTDHVAAVGRAQQSSVAELQVIRDEATVAFPEGIDFRLDVAAGDPIAEVDLLYRPAADEMFVLARPTFDPGRDVSLTHRVDLEAGVLPPGLDLRYRWRVTEADGDVAETPERTVAWRDTRFDWTPLAGERVTVYGYGGDVGVQQTVLDVASATLDRLAAEIGAEPASPLRIWSYASAAEFAGALAPNSEPWVAGSAFPSYGLILAVLPPGNWAEVERVIPHEVSHQVLFAATRNPFGGAPAWLDEGLAVRAQGNGTGAYAGLVRGALDAGRLPSLRALNGSFAYDPEAAQLAYAQSLSVVTFLLDRWGDAGTQDLIAAFGEGLTPDEATRRALGVDLAGLDGLWRAWLAQQPRAVAGVDPFAWLGPSGAALLASGGLVVGLAVLLALVLGARGLRRGYHGPDPVEGEA